mmetsp:Transcript_106123/g.280103  ORF Transcript_106123/g.280103 Transcript_106123/m.280103 type:complete len:241 (-) Transcript_106123:822-1544(-)
MRVPMPPSRKQMRSFSCPLKYASTSEGVGVFPAMIISAILLVSMDPSRLHGSGGAAPGSGTTCSTSQDTSHLSDFRKLCCCSGVDLSILIGGAAATGAGAAGGFFTLSANSRKRSTCCPSAELFRITSSHNFRVFSSMSVYRGRPPGFTMDMFKPFGTAWYKKTECIASRTELRPRNENERLLRPPLNEMHGQVRLSSATALMKSMPYELCSGSPVAIVSTLQSKMMSSGGKSSFARISL